MFGLMEIEINPQIILTIVYDDFWTICEHHHNSYRYKMKRNLLNRTREVLRLGDEGNCHDIDRNRQGGCGSGLRRQKRGTG